jgi:H+/Cl- antiporter ClcA
VFVHLHERHTHAFGFLIFKPLSFVLARWLVQRFAPAAAGSGIPQVMASLNLHSEQKPLLEFILNIKVLLTKIVSCCICLLGGGLVGREGPMVQISAIIFLHVGRFFRRFLPKIDDYSLIVTGGAAGVAAAFNTPLGGIVFAIEELIDQHFSKIRSALIVGVIIADMVAQSLIGPHLFFGEVRYQMPKIGVVGAVLFISLAAGILGGAVWQALDPHSVTSGRLPKNQAPAMIFALWFSGRFLAGLAARLSRLRCGRRHATDSRYSLAWTNGGASAGISTLCGI